MLLFVLPALANGAAVLAVAAFVLTGSQAARVLGSLVALGSFLQLVGPAVVGGLPTGMLLVLNGGLSVLYLGTALALLLPARGRG